MPAIRTLLILAASLALPALAQQPDTLLYSIPAPPGAAQTGTELGSSVAVDGGITVAGVPFDNTDEYFAGSVRVFETATGAVLHVIPNPRPTHEKYFGFAVAISGTRVVVGTGRRRIGGRNVGRVYVYDLQSATPTVPAIVLRNPEPKARDDFGGSVAISGTHVVVGIPGNNGKTNNVGSAYVYDLGSATPTVPVIKLDNPRQGTGDGFATSVAISGKRVVIGAQSFHRNAPNVGRAYVYHLGSRTPTLPIATLENPSPSMGDRFGAAVAISDTRVVVGAAQDDEGATDTGRAYVYHLRDRTPAVPVLTLNSPAAARSAAFGYAVAISGSRVVIGARGSDSAYVYDLGGATPALPVVTLNNPNATGYGGFGSAVSLSEARLVVGAPFDHTGAYNAGSAYTYELSGPTPEAPMAMLNDPGPSAYDRFGAAVAVSGTRVLVGAPGRDYGADTVTSAYVYDLASPMPAEPATQLDDPAPGLDNAFGAAVAMSGTLAVVGAYRDDTGGPDAGSVYVFDLAGPTPTVPIVTLHNPAPGYEDYFGHAVDISGTRVVVGAPGRYWNSDNIGNAYVYDLASATPAVPVATLHTPVPRMLNFGYSVAISGARVVVGALIGDEGTASFGGSAYVYDVSSGTPAVPVVTLSNPIPEIDDGFGSSVAIAGTRVVIGAEQDDTAGRNTGSVYVYDLSQAMPTIPVATLHAPEPQRYSYFGGAVAISDTRVLVGARYSQSEAIRAGSAYVYDLSSATPALPVATLNNPSPADADQFGYAVAIDGATAIIGTPDDDSPQFRKGSVYIFGPAD